MARATPPGGRNTFGLCALVFALALFSLPSKAQVPTAPKVAAQALFDRGYARMTDGKFAEAARYFEQSQALEAGIGTMLYLAHCYTQLGRVASAWALFRDAASAAKAAGQMDRAKRGAERAAELEASLPMLTLQVAATNRIPGLVISLNGMPLPTSAWEVPMPVDPGDNRVEAHAPGYHDYSVTQTVVADGNAVIVAVPPLAAIALVAVPLQPPADAGHATAIVLQPAATTSYADTPDVATWQRPVALAAGGLGVVALGVGAYFGLSAIARNKTAMEHCPNGSPCNDALGVRYSEQANAAARWTNGFLIGGLVLAGAGVALWLTAPSKSSTQLALHSNARSLTVALTGAL